MRRYADGATLVLQGLHRIWPPLIDFARRLGAELRQPLQVNAYLTPAGNKGFATHYDTHDVFVLQVDGTKRWRIHEPVLPDPLERQAWGGRKDEVTATADGPPALDVVLAPGDALYLPRGWLHSAEAQGERSLHLTIGVRALTRYALVEELLGLAVRGPAAAGHAAVRDGRVPIRTRSGPSWPRRWRRCATGCRPPTRPRWPTGCGSGPGRRPARRRSARWPSSTSPRS